MRVLIACEFSGRVRDAFIARGHAALSCDLLPTEVTGPHYTGDIRDLLTPDWDMLIAFPPCTYLTVCGNRWRDKARNEQANAVEFVKTLWRAPIAKIAIENPVGVLTREFRKYSQIIQPYEHGHPVSKRTCLWLKGLPDLKPTDIVYHEPFAKYSPGWKPDRSKERSRTYSGIAKAMAEQWG